MFLEETGFASVTEERSRPLPSAGGPGRPTDAPTGQKAKGHICPLCCSWDAHVFLPSDIGPLVLGPWAQTGIHTQPSWCSGLWTAGGELVLCSLPPFIHVYMYALVLLLWRTLTNGNIFMELCNPHHNEFHHFYHHK